MKKLLTFAASAALSLSLFTTNETASADSGKTIDTLQVNSFKEHVLESIKADYPNAQFVDITLEEYEQQKKISDALSVTPYAPAPPLSYVEVYAAISTNYPTYEYFSQNQLSSVQDHGGAEMYIVTEEIGYGHIRKAELNGSKLTEKQRLFIDYNNDTIIDGYYIWWDASGHEDGSFYYENTSTNYPWNKMFDSMYIK